MLTKKFLIVLTIVVIFIAASCAPKQSAPQAAAITLSLAVSDGKGAPSESSVLVFVEEVRILSEGNIIIEPTWDAGADTEVGFEQGVIALVKAGQYDLGLAASRAWEESGITAFQPLQTPFLIDNDALAISVATSDTAAHMLDQLSSSDLTGLTIWPEDLRHPFSIVPGKPLLSPDDFAGATIRTTSMGITAEIMEALGGKPEFEAFDYQGTESGLRQGSTLTGQPIATGNVVFFPKFQVLFANSTAFDRLSDSQKNILREASGTTQAKTIADRPGDVENGAAWCEDGGSIVLATETQLAAFQTAVQPVVDLMEANADNAKNIAAIRELKAKTQPGPAVTACGVIAAEPAPDETEETWSEGLPPNGLWQVDLTIEDVVRMGVLKSNAEGWAGFSSYEFRDGEGLYHGEFLDGLIMDCPFTYKVVEDFFRLTYVDLGLGRYECGDQVDDLQWRLDPDGLHFNVVAVHSGLLLENTALYEAKPWQEIEEWSEGLPPNGVYQVELTADDFVEAGVLLSVAQQEWAGVYTFTFNKGNFQFDWQGEQFTGKCQATYEVVEDFVRLTYYTDTNDCKDQVDDVRWRLDDDGLHWQVITIQNAPSTEFAVIYKAKPWQKIGNP